MSKDDLPVALNDFYKVNGFDARVFNNEPSLTRQEFAEECDINALMAKYEGFNTGPGNLPNLPGSAAEMFYVDFADSPKTLMEYMTFMDSAQQAFMSLPAAVRKEFGNNPVDFVSFAGDPGNLEQMRSWGLAPPAKAPSLTPLEDASPRPSGGQGGASEVGGPASGGPAKSSS